MSAPATTGPVGRGHQVAVRWCWASENALLARLDEEDLTTAAAAARALRDRVSELASSDLELVVGAASLLVRFSSLAPDDEAAFAAVAAPLVAIDRIEPNRLSESVIREHRLEVAYGGADGPDLATVARLAGLSEREVVTRHAGALYTVAFVGFSPGFGYLLGLPEALALPRRASPRPRVPAGSVAVAGAFSGVYPRATPGGWHLLGRTDASLFDPAADPPALLAPGDRVRFLPR